MNEYIWPAPLKAGDRVAIVSPSGCIDPGIIDSAAALLRGAGYEVVEGRHARSSHGRFAGTRAERLGDLQWALDDATVRAVLCSRGGYGAVQLLDGIDLGPFMLRPKWVSGYSDITAIHALLQRHGCVSLHALMLKHIAERGLDDPCVAHMLDVMCGGGCDITAPAHPLNRAGRAEGRVRGGNLSVLAGLRGTPYDIGGEGTILFVEDVGERPYRIDRMMWGLKLSGVLGRLSGLVVGQVTGYEDDRSMCRDTYGLIADMMEGTGCPVAFGFPVGHVAHNEPVVCGARGTLEVTPHGARLTIRRPQRAGTADD